MLRTIRVAWQNENASEHAQAVLKVAAELHERLSTMADHLAKVGRGLDSAVNAYNKAVGSYGSRVLVSARRLEGLAATQSTLDDLAPLPSRVVAAPAAPARGRPQERGRRMKAGTSAATPTLNTTEAADRKRAANGTSSRSTLNR